jgi:hypothetical protein
MAYAFVVHFLQKRPSSGVETEEFAIKTRRITFVTHITKTSEYLSASKIACRGYIGGGFARDFL